MPRGGRRPGAGRPRGTSNPLPLGAVGAIKALGLRVPENTPQRYADDANEAYDTVVSVMRGEIDPEMAKVKLSAARVVREEVCGPVKQQVEHSGQVVNVSINRTVRK